MYNLYQQKKQMLIGIDGNEANVRRRVGSNQYAFELLWGLYGLRTTHRFVVYLHKKPLPNLPPERKDWVYKVFGPSFLWTRWRLPLELYSGKNRLDVFFTPGHYAPAFCPVPLVCSIMDLGFLKFPKQFTRKDFLQLACWTAASVRKASHILAISKTTKNDIIKTYKIPGEKITVTYPGYDKNKFNIGIKRQEEERVKEKYKISQDYFLFLGTLKPSKNIEGLLKAYAQLTGFNPVSLVVAGKKGWLYEPIYAKVRKLGLEEKVIFTDFVSEEDVPGLMAGASVFILPSFWEGFGIPVVEAMACGIPVVVSNAGSLPEVVGQAGVMVDPYNPESLVSGLREALEKRKELARKGLVQAKKFSWQVCAQKTLEVLENQR